MQSKNPNPMKQQPRIEYEYTPFGIHDYSEFLSKFEKSTMSVTDLDRKLQAAVNVPVDFSKPPPNFVNASPKQLFGQPLVAAAAGGLRKTSRR